MTLKKYLLSIMDKSQVRKLQGALCRGDAVIVDGPQGPTGKSTLVKVLREHGYRNVFEAWDVHKVTLDKPVENMIEKYYKTVQ